MSTLLLRLAAPLQAWGADSKYDVRKTQREPTKSGVVGMLASALGQKRDEPLSNLASLRFGVRVDREGELLRDFHMVHPNGSQNAKVPYLTTRYYLSDAVFLVGLEGDESFLKTIEQALKYPAFAPYLGRRSCPPEGRICLGMRSASLLDALRQEPWLLSAWRQSKRHAEALRLLTDAADASATAARQRDLPISFDQSDRRYGFRAMTEHAPVPVDRISPLLGNLTEHDPMTELGGDEDVLIPNRP